MEAPSIKCTWLPIPGNLLVPQCFLVFVLCFAIAEISHNTHSLPHTIMSDTESDTETPNRDRDSDYEVEAPSVLSANEAVDSPYTLLQETKCGYVSGEYRGSPLNSETYAWVISARNILEIMGKNYEDISEKDFNFLIHDCIITMPPNTAETRVLTIPLGEGGVRTLHLSEAVYPYLGLIMMHIMLKHVPNWPDRSSTDEQLIEEVRTNHPVLFEEATNGNSVFNNTIDEIVASLQKDPSMFMPHIWRTTPDPFTMESSE